MLNIIRQLIFSYLSILFVAGVLNAEIIKTSHILDIKNEITDDTLVLFNIAEVLMDTETSLGTQAWRKFIRSRVDSKLHDELTFFVFERVPPKAPEFNLSDFIHELQVRGHVALAFTSRGRQEWYSSQISNVDLLTEKLLLQIGIDFSKTHLKGKLVHLPTLFEKFYHQGIIYATNNKDKQELLLEILEKTGYHPSKIIFVEDKIDSLISIEKSLSSLGIPFVGYAYNRTAQDHAQFDPFLATIQLDFLITYGELLSDEEAMKIRNEYTAGSLEQYFEEVITKWKQRSSEAV